MSFSDLVRFILPLIFVTAILSTSDFVTLPHEDDVDWDMWDDAPVPGSRFVIYWAMLDLTRDLDLAASDRASLRTRAVTVERASRG